MLVPYPPASPPRKMWFCGYNMNWLRVSLAVTSAIFIYSVINYFKLERSSVLFIGLPAFLALSLGNAGPAKFALLRVWTALSLTLLLCYFLKIEGVAGILLPAPLFYLMSGVLALSFLPRWRSPQRRLMHCSALAVGILFTLEGLGKVLKLSPDETVVVTKVLPMSVEEARIQIASGPEFDEGNKLPALLRLGLPKPVEVEGRGVKVGDRWTLSFQEGGEVHRMKVEVIESSDQKLRMRCLDDDSSGDRWINWRQVNWHFSETQGQAEVRMEIRYRRLVDPAWYFSPTSRRAVHMAGEYFMAQCLPEA